MTADQVVAFLKNYNQWRRGDDSVQQPHPKELGEAIDAAIHLLALKSWDAVWNDVLEERKERNKAMNALRSIAGAYCHEKSTFQLALMAYEMSAKARWTLQEIEQKEEA